MTLLVGLRFPPTPELLKIFKACGVTFPQFLCRVITIIVGLMVFFRECGEILTLEHLCKMYKFTKNSQGQLLDFLTCNPSKNQSSSFFFVKNEWGLLKGWGKLKVLLNSPYPVEKGTFKTLNFPDAESLQQELCYIGQYVIEEKLFKVGRSPIVQLKKYRKIPEISTSAFKPSSKSILDGQREGGSSPLKKRKAINRANL
ncbi:hypothetical protein IEQ34_014012 [Dendrobium chrysotoxum]|uniref:Uncharacterized protein n=1 Tax=Dendrobium chrysotoxum TaxID=161865 RepID=A0AAV7G1W6_DENCH|nr:hypothetical protein IEQ34_014012 [Dendrobium chrysotoxum]